MLLDPEQIHMSELIENNRWDVDKLVFLFGMNFNPLDNNLGNIDNMDHNFWVW